MKISCVIPTYNRAYCLNRAIDSVLNQKVTALELIVVDDGSTDETFELIKKYPSIHYYKTENFGVSRARNLGVEKSIGDWIAFLDSDDEWLPSKLEKQIDFLNDNPHVPLVHGEEIWIRKGKRVNQKKIHQKFGGNIFEKCLPLCVISPSASLINKKTYWEMGGFNSEFPVCEDYDLWLKITSLYPVGFIEDPIIVKHGGHDDQLSGQRSMDYYRILALHQIKKIRSLSSFLENLVDEEIVKKGRILLRGYKKHQNMDHFEQISSIVKESGGNFDSALT